MIRTLDTCLKENKNGSDAASDGFNCGREDRAKGWKIAKFLAISIIIWRQLRKQALHSDLLFSCAWCHLPPTDKGSCWFLLPFLWPHPICCRRLLIRPRKEIKPEKIWKEKSTVVGVAENGLRIQWEALQTWDDSLHAENIRKKEEKKNT